MKLRGLLAIQIIIMTAVLLSILQWLKASATREYDGFEIKRKGNTNCKVKIVMQLDSQPEKYKLSPQLASILDIQEETKSQTIRAMWHYVKVCRM